MPEQGITFDDVSLDEVDLVRRSGPVPSPEVYAVLREVQGLPKGYALKITGPDATHRLYNALRYAVASRWPQMEVVSTHGAICIRPKEER